MRPLRSAGAGAEQARRDGLVGAVFGDQQPRRQVDRDGSPADQGQHSEQDADDGHVDVEVPGEAGGDSAEHPALDRAAERPGRSGFVGGVGGVVARGGAGRRVHGSSLRPGAARHHWEHPRSVPDPGRPGSGASLIPRPGEERDDGGMAAGTESGPTARTDRGPDGALGRSPAATGPSGAGSSRAGSSRTGSSRTGTSSTGPSSPGASGSDPLGTELLGPGRRGRRFGRPGSRPWMRRPPGSGPLRRSREDRLAGGVAAGLAARTGLDPTVVRTGFVVATVFGLIGAAAYVLAWLLIPAEGADANIAARALTDRRGIALVAGLASLLVVLLVIASALRASWVGSLAWPLVISVAGLTLIWRNAPPDEQAVLQRLADPLLGLAQRGGSRRRLRARGGE